MGQQCPYCGQRRIRLKRGGQFLTWWHPVGGLLTDRVGYVKCGAQALAEWRASRLLTDSTYKPACNGDSRP